MATDGDADRLGIVDETGRYINTLQTLALLLLHVYRNKGWRGAVARTYSQSLMIPRIASSFGLEIFERPIGFKNIGELMLEREILIGGEESGGIGLSKHLPERDGIFINLLFLDMLAASGRTCTELIQEMWQEFGEFHYDRRDLHVPIEIGNRVVEKWRKDPPATFAGRQVQEIGNLDGSKVFLDKDAWILFRQSGTEPLLRVYCEAPSRICRPGNHGGGPEISGTNGRGRCLKLKVGEVRVSLKYNDGHPTREPRRPESECAPKLPITILNALRRLAPKSRCLSSA